MKKVCENTCGDYNAKSQTVNSFISKAETLKKSVVNLSERQQRIYDVFIELLNDAPRTYTMRDVHLLTFCIEHIMECECAEEDNNKTYRVIFDALDSKIKELQTQELENNKKEIRKVFCWSSNPHFCELSKPYYDKTVELGLMNKDYSWAKTTTKFQIAKWLDLFARRFKFTKQWVWAEEVWPKLKNLKQSLTRCNEAGNEEKTNIIVSIFKK